MFKIAEHNDNEILEKKEGYWQHYCALNYNDSNNDEWIFDCQLGLYKKKNDASITKAKNDLYPKKTKINYYTESDILFVTLADTIINVLKKNKELKDRIELLEGSPK